MQHKAAHCPCDSGLSYAQCCKPWHQGEPASNAESLMRSRYTAYTLAIDDYLLSTWHPSTRPAGLEDAQPLQWIGLKIVRHSPSDADNATVEFIARYKVNGKAEKLHEVSRFVREHGQWLYIDGDFIES